MRWEIADSRRDEKRWACTGGVTIRVLETMDSFRGRRVGYEREQEEG